MTQDKLFIVEMWNSGLPFGESDVPELTCELTSYDPDDREKIAEKLMDLKLRGRPFKVFTQVSNGQFVEIHPTVRHTVAW